MASRSRTPKTTPKQSRSLRGESLEKSYDDLSSCSSFCKASGVKGFKPLRIESKPWTLTNRGQLRGFTVRQNPIILSELYFLSSLCSLNFATVSCHFSVETFDVT